MLHNYTLLPVQEIGQNQYEKGGGLIIRHGRIIRILQYMVLGVAVHSLDNELGYRIG